MNLLTTAEAAEYLGISYWTLARLRREGGGPRWIKLTNKGSIRYRRDDLNKYKEEGAA
jgi:excisionase family DNA binding protein